MTLPDFLNLGAGREAGSYEISWTEREELEQIQKKFIADFCADYRGDEDVETGDITL